MTSRTTRSTVTFAFPFVISGFPDELPAGNYEIIVEEDLLQNLSFVAYQRTATYLLINRQEAPGRKQMYQVDSEDWDLTLSIDRERATKAIKSEAALERERMRGVATIGQNAHQKPLKKAKKSHQEVADRQAIEQGENEGMIVYPE